MLTAAESIRVVIGLYSDISAFTIQERHLEKLRTAFPKPLVIPVTDQQELSRNLSGASVYWGWKLPPALIGRAQSLRWVATPAAGLDWILSEPLVKSGIPVTNSHFHGKIIAESVVGMLLFFSRQLGTCYRLQTTVPWCRTNIEPGLTTLRNKKVAIVGFGPLGGQIARLLDAFGMRITGLNRSLRNDSGIPVTMRPMADLPTVLSQSEYIILTLPNSPETELLFSRKMLSMIRRGASLVNVGRGNCIDEKALYDSLVAGQLKGAGLDVFQEEPLPASSPLRKLSNVLITPHASAITEEYMDYALDEFMDNLERFLAGKPLKNVIRQDLP